MEEIKKVLTAVRYNLSNIRHHQYLFGAAMIKVIKFKYCSFKMSLFALTAIISFPLLRDFILKGQPIQIRLK